MRLIAVDRSGAQTTYNLYSEREYNPMRLVTANVEAEDTMTFEECIIECAKNQELIKEFDRLVGTNLQLKGAPIELAVDKATALHPCRPSNGVNWNSRKPGMSNGQRIIAAFAGVIFAASLLVSPVKAQDVQPQPTPTVTVGGGPQIAVEHKLFLPLISTSEMVNGCDDCGVSTDGRYWGGQQAASWRPSCNGKAA
jgi:hypothetical protein